MPIDLIEGFDNYGAIADLTQAGKWGSVLEGSSYLSFTTGRFDGDGGALRCAANGGNRLGMPVRVFKNGPQTRFAFGFAVRVSHARKQGWVVPIASNGAPQPYTFWLGILDTGVIAVGNAYAPGSGVDAPIGQSTIPIGLGDWNWVECFCDTATGYVGVWLNGNQVIDGAPGITFPTPTHGLAFGGATGSYEGTTDLDDLFVDVGIPAGTYVPRGDSRVETFSATSTDSLGIFAVMGAPNAHTAVSDRLATTYIQSSTIGDIAMFDSTETLTGNPVKIHAVNVNVRAVKTDAGTRAVRGIVSVGGISKEGPDHYLASQAGYYQNIFETNPVDNGPWSKGAVESAKFGVKISE